MNESPGGRYLALAGPDRARRPRRILHQPRSGRLVMSSRHTTSSRGFARLAVAGAAALWTALPAQAGDGERGGRLEGVWRVTRHATNCQTGADIAVFPALMNFDAGGAMGGYDVPPGTSPALRSPAYGTWKREEGWRQFSFRQVGYTYDATG